MGELVKIKWVVWEGDRKVVGEREWDEDFGYMGSIGIERVIMMGWGYGKLMSYG